GNGHAVLVARQAVGDEPFAMLWGDNLVVGPPSGVAQLLAARERLGGSVAAAKRVPKDLAGRYGIFAGKAVDDRTIRVTGVIEKPAPGEAPSDLASVHGYVLESEIFGFLADQPPGRNGEIWLTDAVTRLAKDHPVWAIVLEGRDYDAGDRAGYVAAFVDAALERPDTGPALRKHLSDAGWKPPGDR
ncbi:MAG TPA: sugar phosphate nucleotidyltransferase, partial [Candidatus Limnocylindria bacterium]|nr:sugar phosphate nucleotidyltransferase [Candidatus Limnocylindria bacterium]